MNLSVVVCTHNPNLEILTKVLESIRAQTLPVAQWELLVIDNSSTPPLDKNIDISWHSNARIVIEQKLGLSFARLAGVAKAQTELIVFVDDDNILEENYLEKAATFHVQHPQVGCFGGKSIAIFETPPPEWFFKAGINLGCQEYGDQVYVSDYRKDNYQLKDYPIKAPIGTGMVIQKKAFMLYLEEVKHSTKRLALGRKGKALTSGEDNDIVLTIVKRGFEIAYVPDLIVKHLIPQKRYSLDYLKQMAFESSRSWIKVLDLHGISKWEKISPKSLPLRYLKSWMRYKPWKSPLNRIRYQGSCGTYKGLSELN